MAALSPLTPIPGESPADLAERLIAHIGRHMTGRDLALRTEFRREIARLSDDGVRMDHALSHLDDRLGAEIRQRVDEDRRIDQAVREIPGRIMDLQEAMLQTKTEVITAIQGRPASPPVAAPALPPSDSPPTLGALVLQSRPVQALVVALAVLLVAVSVGVLAMALGRDRAADVADAAVDKLPRYEIRQAPAPADLPAPGESPEPSP